MLRARLERLRPAALRWAAKFAFFNAAVALVYALLLFVLSPPGLAAEFAAAGVLTSRRWPC